MKFLKICAAGFLSVILLTGCLWGDSPSDAEIEKAVISRWGLEGCSNIVISEVRKINGIRSENGRTYKVIYSHNTEFLRVNDINNYMDGCNPKRKRDIINFIAQNWSVFDNEEKRKPYGRYGFKFYSGGWLKKGFYCHLGNQEIITKKAELRMVKSDNGWILEE